jgi:hypothetical protein
MVLTTIEVQIDAHLAVGQGVVSLWQFQIQSAHVDINHGFRPMGTLQVFFSLLQALTKWHIDVKMDFTYWGGFLVGAGFAPAFDRHGAHNEASVVDCWILLLCF